MDLYLLLECRACLLVWCEVCGAEEEVGTAVVGVALFFEEGRDDAGGRLDVFGR